MKPCTAAAVSSVLVPVLAAAGIFAAAPVRAAPDEIRVMTDDLTDPGDVSVELHAASVRARTGATTRHLVQGLVELSYGVTPTLELSLQLPVSREPGWRANGANLELQAIAPHDPQAGPYWGARLELGRARSPLESRWTPAFELRPIFGYRAGGWHAAVNGVVRAPLSGPDRKAIWEPAGKLTHAIGARAQLGVEYYVQAAQRPDGADEGVARRRLALLVLDTKVRGVALNVGVGRGIGPSGDGRVVKFIAGFEL